MKIIQSGCFFCIAETFYLFCFDEEEADREREREFEEEDDDEDDEEEEDESEECLLFLRCFFDFRFLLLFFYTFYSRSLYSSFSFLGVMATGSEETMPI